MFQLAFGKWSTIGLTGEGDQRLELPGSLSTSRLRNAVARSRIGLRSGANALTFGAVLRCELRKLLEGSDRFQRLAGDVQQFVPQLVELRSLPFVEHESAQVLILAKKQRQRDDLVDGNDLRVAQCGWEQCAKRVECGLQAETRLTSLQGENRRRARATGSVGFARQGLQLNRPVLSRFGMRIAGRDELGARHQVRRQSHLQQARRLDAQAGGFEGTSVGMFAELRGIESQLGFARRGGVQRFRGDRLQRRGHERSAERCQLLMQRRIRRIRRLRRGAVLQESLQFIGQLSFRGRVVRRLPFREQGTRRNHMPGRSAGGLGIEVPNVRVSQTVWVRIAGQDVGRDFA